MFQLHREFDFIELFWPFHRWFLYRFQKYPQNLEVIPFPQYPNLQIFPVIFQ